MKVKLNKREKILTYEDMPYWEIKGFKGYYISPMGVIISFKRKEPRFMSQQLNSKGYLQVKLWDGVRYTTRMVHKLVLTTFKGEAPSKHHTVNHINEDKTDNCIENLEWKLHKDNVEYSLKPVQCIHPEGHIITITNVLQYCKDHNLHRSNFNRMLYGEANTCKGYRTLPRNKWTVPYSIGNRKTGGSKYHLEQQS